MTAERAEPCVSLNGFPAFLARNSGGLGILGLLLGRGGLQVAEHGRHHHAHTHT